MTIQECSKQQVNDMYQNTTGQIQKRIELVEGIDEKYLAYCFSDIDRVELDLTRRIVIQIDHDETKLGELQTEFQHIELFIKLMHKAGFYDPDGTGENLVRHETKIFPPHSDGAFKYFIRLKE